MAVGYIKKKQKLSVNGTIREVYLAKVCHGTEVRTDALADEISKTCSASPADVLMVLHAMEDCVGTHLAAGDVVRLDYLGAFLPTISAEMREVPEKVNQFSIRRVGVNFKPTKRLMKTIKDAGVRLVDRTVYDTATESKDE